MKSKKVSLVKHRQRESLFYRQISTALNELFFEHAQLADLFVTKIELEAGGGFCKIFLASMKPDQDIAARIEELKPYVPSLRSAVAQKIQGRYTPKLWLVEDTGKPKQRDIETLLHKISEEISLQDEIPEADEE